MSGEAYKIQQLTKMAEYEESQPPQGQYGAHLQHWSGHGNPINIDAGAIRLLIQYYTGIAKSRRPTECKRSGTASP